MKDTIAVGVVGCGYCGPNLVRNFKALSVPHITTAPLISTIPITMGQSHSYLRQEEPEKVESQHLLDCIEKGTRFLTGGQRRVATGSGLGGSAVIAQE